MNVMVLGASSAVGAGVAEAFSPGNRLLLTGREESRLGLVADRCRACGASRVDVIAWDLRRGSGELKNAARELRPDLIINAASAASRLRDPLVPAGELEGVVAVDLLAPLDLVRSVLADRGSRPRPVGIVFISSFLAAVESPDRAIYGALKRIHEKALEGMAAELPDLRLLIVRVSKRIPVAGDGPEARKLGAAVQRGYLSGKCIMYHGVTGRLAAALYRIQPALFELAVKASRRVRDRGRKVG